ncbi:MAG: cytochrome c [Gammaproteobacteria bacterium]|nr:MAG: cytochrome c [Gammaproteobacteria bacterium]
MWRRTFLLAASLALAGLALARDAEVPDSARQVELRNMLLQDCGSCHGLTLKGGLGPALRPENLAGKPREFLFETIRLGRPGTAMPPWGPILKDAEIAWLVDQLVSGKALQEAQR